MKCFCTVLALLSPLLLTTALASAFDLPRYDVDSYCQQVAQVSGGSATIYNGCIDMEQSAYNDLKQSWASIPGKTAKYCNRVARTSNGSYTILQGCIDMEMDAAGNKAGFQY